MKCNNKQKKILGRPVHVYRIGLWIKLDILFDNPRNQPHRHIPLCINPRHYKTDLILLSRHPVVITAMSDGIHADVKPDEYGALMDIRDCPGILALDLALA